MLYFFTSVLSYILCEPLLNNKECKKVMCVCVHEHDERGKKKSKSVQMVTKNYTQE